MIQLVVVGLCEFSTLHRMTRSQVTRLVVFGCTDGCCAACMVTVIFCMLLNSLEFGQRSAPRAAVCVSLRFSWKKIHGEQSFRVDICFKYVLISECPIKPQPNSFIADQVA
jgi:hypothetical protein